MALLRQSCLRKCPHFPFWKRHCSCRPFASAHWSSRPTIFTYNNASDRALLNLDCISLLTMPSVWTKTLIKVKWTWFPLSELPVTKKRHPEIPAGQHSLCGYDPWHHAGCHCREGGGGRVFCDMLTTLPSSLNGHHMLVFLDSNKAPDWIITGWSGASGSGSTRCFCPLLDSVCTKQQFVTN